MKYEELNEEAKKAAVDHADRIHEDWTGQAYAKSILYLTYARMNNIKEFQICDIRRFIDFAFTPLPEPTTKREWGHVARLLRQAKLIEIVGYKPTNNTTAHNAIAAIYKVL